MEISRELLIKFSREECTTDEVAAIKEWLENGSWTELPDEENVPEDVKKKVWEKLQYHTHQAPAKGNAIRNLRKNILKVAAILLAVIGTAACIYYYTGKWTSKESVIYTTNVNGYQKIILPDSSFVFLSPSSILTVEQPYDVYKREIRLKGEAVFEVAQNASTPFEVVTGNLVTTALGTSFKVTSFPERSEINIALSYGKIMIKDKAASDKANRVYLNPGEEAIYNKATETIEKIEGVSDQFDYRTNVLYFKDAGLEEVVEKLEKYYHVNIQYSSLKGAHWSVSGEFDYQPLEIVMNAIAYSCNIKYEINGENLILFK